MYRRFLILLVVAGLLAVPALYTSTVAQDTAKTPPRQRRRRLRRRRPTSPT